MEAAHVRFGSLADMCAAKSDVRFTPDSNPESGLPRKTAPVLFMSLKGHSWNGWSFFELVSRSSSLDEPPKTIEE
jgi:hypothetical protein